MSLTGLELRRRVRRRFVRALDALAERVDPEAPPDVGPEPVAPEPAPASSQPPPPQAATATPAPASTPLPALPKPPALRPPGAAAGASTASPERTKAAGGATLASERAATSPEDRQKQHWDRTRKGILRFVHEHGGKAGLRELHEYSERTFFVAHVGFSRLMEELTDEDLLDYDHDTAVAALTDAGRAAMG